MKSRVSNIKLFVPFCLELNLSNQHNNVEEARKFYFEQRTTIARMTILGISFAHVSSDEYTDIVGHILHLNVLVLAVSPRSVVKCYV